MRAFIGTKPDHGAAGAELVAKYSASVSTGTVGHITDFGAVTSLTALFRPCKAVGFALTVRAPQGDGTILHEAISAIKPGDILVIDTSQETRRAMWGGVAGYAAMKAGVGGVIIDGPVTDWAELGDNGTPVWCRGTTPLTGRRLGFEGQVNVPISIAGTTVAPGDLVLADSDGIYFLPFELAQEMVDSLAAREAREVVIRARLDAGEKLPDISKSLAAEAAGEHK